jgi:hypothetical protein
MIYKKIFFITSLLLFILFSIKAASAAEEYKCKVAVNGTDCVPCIPDPNQPDDLSQCKTDTTDPTLICSNQANRNIAITACSLLKGSACPGNGQALHDFTPIQCSSPVTLPACPSTNPGFACQATCATPNTSRNDFSCSTTGQTCCQLSAVTTPPVVVPPPQGSAIKPIPKPPVACNKVEDNEFHSLRPYQASVCNTDYQTALYCGNSVFLTDTFSVDEDGTATPSDPGTALNNRTCVEHPELGVQICDFTLQRDKTFSIDLRDLELPIAGNTEDVRNYTNNAAKPDQIKDNQKMNEYVSWYLNGVNNRAEYPFPAIGTPEDLDRIVNFSGPLNKLLPRRIQDIKRSDQAYNALASRSNSASGIDQRHNQIVGCTASIPVPIFLPGLGLIPVGIARVGNFPVACNTIPNLPIIGGEDKHRLAEWVQNLKLPPVEESYNGRPFIEYWADYQKWRGKYCKILEAPAFIPLAGGMKILMCFDDPGDVLRPNFYASMFPYIPYSSTEDTIGKVRVEQNPLAIGQSDPITVTNESVSQASSNIYVPHMAEDYQLANTLQQTFVSKDLDLNAPADATTTVGDEFCNVVQVKNNPGDNLFGDQLTPRLSYASQFSCQFVLDPNSATPDCKAAYPPKCHTVSCTFGDPDCSCADPTSPSTCSKQDCDDQHPKCFPKGYSCGDSKGELDCGADYVCSLSCDPPEVRECAFTTNHSIPVYTETPYLDDIWAKLVAGPSSVFKHIFPKIGIGSPLLDIVDAPSAASTTYSTTNAGTTVKAADVRSGVSAELYFPHLGGIHEYFLECIQTALRPQGLGRECGDFNSPSDITVAGNVIADFLVVHGAKHPQIRGYQPDGNISLVSNPLEQASYWRKPELSQSFGSPFPLGDAKGGLGFTAPGLALGSDGTIYTAWAGDLTHDSATIFMRKKTPTDGWLPIQTVIHTAFSVHARIAVATNGDIFIIWHGTNLFYVRSTDGGASWSTPQSVGVDYGADQPASIASGPENKVAIAFFQPISNGIFSIKVAIWNGSSFAVEEILKDKVAEPSVTITPNGEYFVAWRKEGSIGPWVSSRPANGTWTQPLNLNSTGLALTGSIGIASDTNGGVHIFWAQGIDGVFYSYKGSNSPWQGTQKIASTGNYLVNADLTTSSGGSYVHGVVEEYMKNDPDAWIHYFLFSGGGSGTGGPIGGGPGTTPPPGGQCSISETEIRRRITQDWGLPNPVADLTSQISSGAGLWSARSILAAERYVSSHGFSGIKQYLTGAWIWYEGASGYPNMYSMNCGNANGGNVSTFCTTTNFQIAGYQVGKDYQNVYNKLYPGASNETFKAMLQTVVTNSRANGKKDIWKYPTQPPYLKLMTYLSDVLQNGQIDQLATSGQQLVSNPSDITAQKRQLLTLIAGKDPNMVAALNSFAVSDGDLIRVLKAHQPGGSNCGYGYICDADEQRIADYAYSLWKLDCTP